MAGPSASARLYDNPTARDFASLLPVSITVHDLGGREKAGTLPRELTGGHGRSDRVPEGWQCADADDRSWTVPESEPFEVYGPFFWQNPNR